MTKKILLLLAVALALLVAADDAEVTSSSTFKFLSVGDWGDKQFTENLAENFDKQGKGAPVALLLGDNFYEAGVQSVNDPQWEKKYLASFQGANLQKSKFLVTSGNHDYYGNVTAQVDYVDPTKRWTFPQLYHARRFEQNGIKVLFIMLDTWRLNGGDALLGHNAATGRTWIRSRAQIWKKVEQGDLAKESAERLEKRYGAPMLGEESAAAARGDVEQLNWLRKVFASKEAVESDWRIVCGHFPIHSGTKGEHGDTKYLVQTLDPLLHELGADAYFSGHDHVLQMINKGKKLHYYGPGAGARKHALMNTKYAGLLGHAEGVLGFMKHTLTKTEMTTTIVDEHAKEVFKYVQHKNKKHQLEENVAVA